MSSRRTFLGGAAVVALPLPVLAAPVSPDADLIRLAREHERLGHLYNADHPEGVDDGHPLAVAAEARRDRITDQQDDLLNGMLDRPPVTLEGLQALAAALVVWDLELLKGGYRDAGSQITASLVRGLLDMRGAS